MDCKQAHRALSAYIDGELELEQVRGLFEHLESCPACRDAHEELRLLKKTFVTPPVVRVSPFFYAKVRDRIRGERRPIPFFRRYGLSGSLAASFGVLAMLLSGIYLGSGLWDSLTTQRQNTLEIATLLGLDNIDDAPAAPEGSLYQDWTNEV